MIKTFDMLSNSGYGIPFLLIIYYISPQSMTEDIFPSGSGLTLKNRRRYSTVYSLAARKNTSRKKRLIKRTRQNRPVPAWVIIRTHRHVRTNPKRRLWRRTDVNVG